MKSSRCVLILYIYFIIQFRRHNIKVKVTATCFDLTSHLQAYVRTKTNYNMPVQNKTQAIKRDRNKTTGGPPSPSHIHRKLKTRRRKTTTDITRTTKTTAPRSSTHVTPNIHVDTIVHRNHFICESQHTL
jgi:hypothetical protein